MVGDYLIQKVPGARLWHRDRYEIITKYSVIWWTWSRRGAEKEIASMRRLDEDRRVYYQLGRINAS